MDTAVLEIGLFPGTEGVAADVRFSPSAASTEQVFGHALPVSLCYDQLCACALDLTAYAKALTGMIFSHPITASAWRHARDYSEASEIPLHVRIRIADDLPRCHDVRWELLRDPHTGEDLSRSGRVWISRALDRIDIAQRDRPTRGMIRSLVALSSPPDLARFGLAPIPQEMGRQAAQALQPFPTMLIDGSAAHYASLETIARGLWRSSSILVIFAHGVRVAGETLLYMQDESGNRQMVRAADVVEAIGGLPHLPVAVVLISCMSGGVGCGEGDGLSSLGARLARLGVSAVLAIAGMVPVQTAEQFVPTFLSDLVATGDVLMALSHARATLNTDRWMPRLWLNGRDGKLWDQPPPGHRWLTGVGLWVA
jgi:hypothetical protein